MHIKDKTAYNINTLAKFCGKRDIESLSTRNLKEAYVIVGGEGHTTESLRRRVHLEYPQMITEGLPEAEIFGQYLLAGMAI